MLNCKFTSIILRTFFFFNGKPLSRMQVIAYFEAIKVFCILEFASLRALIASIT